MEDSEFRPWSMASSEEMGLDDHHHTLSAPISIHLSLQSSSSYPDSESDLSESSFSLRSSSYLRKPRRSKHEEFGFGMSPQEDFASTSDRSGEFKVESKVYHAIFGTGMVYYNDGTYLGIRFDDPKYRDMKLKVIFAVPKMIRIPD